MRRSLPTMSAIGRAMRCAASQVLPWAQEETSYSTRGTQLHRFVSRALDYGKEHALAELELEHHGTAAFIDIEAIRRIFPSTVHSEAAFAYDTASGKGRRLLGVTGRRYEVSETEIAGTLDLVAYEPGRATLRDLKFGHETQSPARENAQIKTQALAVARACGAETVSAGLLYIRPDGNMFDDSCEFDAMDLDAWASDLRVMAGRVRNADAVMTEGREPDTSPSPETCRWCPALAYCPAQTKLVRAMGSEVGVLDTGALSDDEAARAWVRLRQYEGLIKRVKDSLETRARQTPFRLPSGLTVKEVETKTREIDPRIAQDVLVARYGLEVADKAAETSITQASLKRALGKSFGEAFAMIEDAGGVSVKIATRVKEVES
jgi:hypothetical protein